MKETKNNKFSIIDLFAGAGGLSLGFYQTNRFDIKVAFENNPNAQATYIRNHPDVEMYNDVNRANYSDIIKKFGNIDVVIGGPPCQGFSNANRQKNHAVNKNNDLVKQYIKAIIELQPEVFVLENVSMLKSDTHRFYMDSNDKQIVANYKIPTTISEIVLLEEKYKFDHVSEIIKDYKLIDSFLWDEKAYLMINIIYKNKKNKIKLLKSLDRYRAKLICLANQIIITNDKNHYIKDINVKAANAILKYFSNNIEAEELVKELEQPIMVQRMLGKSKEIFDNHLVVEEYQFEKDIVASIKSFSVYDYIKYILGSKSNGYVLDSGILNAADFGVAQKRLRFVIIGVKKTISEKVNLPKGSVEPSQYATVWDAISDISNLPPKYEIDCDEGIKLEDVSEEISTLGKKLRDSGKLYNHTITHTRKTALERFAKLKQGQNFHNLDKLMKESTYTNIERTQNTIYLRLNYNEPSGTVVNVRKSMWIHPEHNRAVSIREAARLQSFPDSFVFLGTKDSQYQQVGNAVPPMLAKAIAEEISRLLMINK